MKGNIIALAALIVSLLYVVNCTEAYASYDAPRDEGFCISDTQCVALDGRPLAVQGESN